MDFPADVLPGAVVHVIQPAVPAGGHAIDLRQPRAGVDPVVQGGHGPPQGEMIVKPVLRALGRKGPGPVGQGAVFPRVPGKGGKQHAPGGQGGKPQEQQHRKITEQFSVVHIARLLSKAEIDKGIIGAAGQAQGACRQKGQGNQRINLSLIHI